MDGGWRELQGGGEGFFFFPSSWKEENILEKENAYL